MPEVHFVGELTGVSGFDGQTVFAKWKIEPSGDSWRLLDGDNSGRTWLAERDAPEDAGVWNEPVNVGYATSSLSGWPKLVLEIYSSDTQGGVDMAGYGCTHLPTTPGEHDIEVVIFRPRGSFVDSLASYFLGRSPRYEDPAVVATADSREGHEVQSVGLIAATVSVVLRNFAQNVVFAAKTT